MSPPASALLTQKPPAVAPTTPMSSNGVETPSEETLAKLAEQSRNLEQATPQQIIAWAVEEYYPKLTMATAFGPEGCVILHMLSEIEPRTHVFNLETGYQFQETLELRD